MKRVKEYLKKKAWAEDTKAFLLYWLGFAMAFVYWEMLIKGVIGDFAEGGSFFFLCFVPAQALVLTFFEGWLSERTNRLLLPAILAIISIYYAVQVGYYKVFGSLFSVSMLGMGNDAITDFGWTIKEIIMDAFGTILLVFVPAIVSVVLGIIRKGPCRKYSLIHHISLLAFAIIFWFMGVGVLKLGGTSRESAYYAYSNSLSDTDTTSRKIGASVTTILETGSYLFGIGSGKSQTVISQNDTEILMPEPTDIALGSDSKPEIAEKEQAVVSEPPKRILESIDFEALAGLSDDAAIKSLCAYFSNMEGSKTNDYSGLFEGYNLIYICAESFWTYAINETVTPTLYKLANNGIVLNNYYNSFKNTTTNGEFAFLTSLWPDVSRDALMGTDAGSFPQSATRFMPYGLGNITANLGYKAYGYHNFKGSYYKRNASLPNLGLECKFMNDGMTVTSSWPSSDLEMMEQSVDDYLYDDKFVTYYMTFSGHGAYNDDNYICAKNLQQANELTADMGLNDQAICYLSCNMELDKAMEYLLLRLEEAGKLKNTLIVITGDHYPYYITANTRKSLAGHPVDDKFEMYKSTCILYNAGLKEPIYTDTYCSNVDILPTVLNLLNIPYDSRMLAGTDIFADGLHKAVLYNKSFITDTVKYDATTGNREWLADVSTYSEEELDDYIEAVSKKIESEYAASLNIMECDFYRFVWENSGLLNNEK